MATLLTSRPVSAADGATRHLVLVGLPGAGKSAVGALVASTIGREFLDFDVEIARRAGMSIPAIFEGRGEPYFRGLEHDLTVELRERQPMVMAPGGGWMGRPDNLAVLRPRSLLVYLEVTPATAVRRMGAGVSERPLLRHADPVGELGRLLATRRAAYEVADVLLNVEMLTLQQVSERIIGSLEGEGSARPGSWPIPG